MTTGGPWRIVPGGRFLMGTDEPAYPADGESPAREVEVTALEVTETAVTVAQFRAFVEATGHVTTATDIGWSFVFGGLLPDDFEPTRGVADAPWWRQVAGADWCHPEGPGSDVTQRLDHPVTHVSWFDASAYAAWLGARLPTEAEWEHAAAGGLVGARFPWGNELEPEGRHMMNVWQGSFPDHNTAADGYIGTAPVRSFPPNGFGLHEMTGNVWEWCADAADDRGRTRRIKGGSYLCHGSYCQRYRVAARSSNTPDSTTGHMGFRVVRNLSST